MSVPHLGLNVSVPPTASLTALLGDLRSIFRTDATRIADELPLLLHKLSGCFRAIPPDSADIEIKVPRAAEVSELLAELQNPITKVAASGLLCDPWSAVRLQTDELRNASTLRWFLDPRGHGSGKAFAEDLLLQVGQILPGFPVHLSRNCSVSVEECPDGDQASRVDIQIEDETFFLVIEVKIKAGEQPGQIARYCKAASTRCGDKPFAVVFLTIDGRQPTTAGDWESKVVAISWAELAASLRRASIHTQPIPRFLAHSFANHIANF